MPADGREAASTRPADGGIGTLGGNRRSRY